LSKLKSNAKVMKVMIWKWKVVKWKRGGWIYKKI